MGNAKCNKPDPTLITFQLYNPYINLIKTLKHISSGEQFMYIYHKEKCHGKGICGTISQEQYKTQYLTNHYSSIFIFQFQKEKCLQYALNLT